MDFNDPELGAPLSAAPLAIIPRGASLLSDWPAKNSKYILRYNSHTLCLYMCATVHACIQVYLNTYSIVCQSIHV